MPDSPKSSAYAAGAARGMHSTEAILDSYPQDVRDAAIKYAAKSAHPIKLYVDAAGGNTVAIGLIADKLAGDAHACDAQMSALRPHGP